MDFLEYILGDFFHFIGFIIILSVVFEGICSIIEQFKK